MARNRQTKRPKRYGFGPISLFRMFLMILLNLFFPPLNKFGFPFEDYRNHSNGQYKRNKQQIQQSQQYCFPFIYNDDNQHTYHPIDAVSGCEYKSVLYHTSKIVKLDEIKNKVKITHISQAQNNPHPPQQGYDKPAYKSEIYTTHAFHLTQITKNLLVLLGIKENDCKFAVHKF